ncbi:MAG: preprotein translocase subunit SecE [Cryomorphaceae bacterium]|nr:preprotein translocase subunit SecE [Cryomorphaceae bacterium]
MSKIRNYFRETVREMVEEVTWPTWKELEANTIIVVVASLIIAGLIFVMDFGFGINGKGWPGLLGFIYENL